MSDSAVTTHLLSLVASSMATTNTTAVQGRQDMPESGKVSPQQPVSEVTRDEVVEAVSDISNYIQNVSRELQFQVDDQAGSTIITVTDSGTDEVIRQIPSEEIVAMARYIAENTPDPVKGLLMNSEG
ncbi:MAG: flagellar protein FlaG [Porticoccus sp.]